MLVMRRSHSYSQVATTLATMGKSGMSSARQKVRYRLKAGLAQLTNVESWYDFAKPCKSAFSDAACSVAVRFL